ncbi:hypothetical protein KY285_001033 [Solanum tuberosum]|nr:hypothetical protein KY285_001033 [Solanum tuberosum]
MCVTKCQKVKNLNYVSAGSLASLRNKKVSKHKHKQNSKCISAVQVMKSNEKYHKNKLNSNYSLNESQVSEQVQQVSLNFTFPTAQTVHEKVQQLSSNSTTPVSQVAHEQVQQQSQLSSTPASQPAEMERIETQQSEDVTQSVDAFTTVMGQDHPGRGDSGPSSQTIDDEKMQKKIKEMEERMQQRMQEKFNAQKDTMERDVTVNIIAQLQRLNPGLTLDPNMLRFTVCSPGDRAALQLINRPSVGCNNQGIENEERREDHSNEDDLDLSREDF